MSNISSISEFVNKSGYARGWNFTRRRFGATIQDGEVTAVFPVGPDWDGYRFHGYAWATREEVLKEYRTKGAAERDWKSRYGS